jgi:hypothetical protein
VVGVGAGYLIYRGVRLLLSLIPPLWPTLVPSLAERSLMSVANPVASKSAPFGSFSGSRRNVDIRACLCAARLFDEFPNGERRAGRATWKHLPL